MPRLLLLLLLLVVSSDLFAQQASCPPLTITPPLPGQNMFSIEQENALGDVGYQQISEDYKIFDDPELTAYAQRVADRVAEHLPLNGTQPRISLVDLSGANAFSMPGGRIMVSRKLIALTKSEDEFAGIIAHELGHSVTRQSAVEMTQKIRRVLGVQSLGSTDEVYQRFHELMENVNRNPKAFRESYKTEERQQGEADRVALEALARAGYDPKAFVDAFDRLAELKGNTGNWWTNFWGTTTSDSKRLREAQRTMAAVSTVCIDRRQTPDDAAFQAWRAKVAEYSGSGHVASLRGVVAQSKLDPPLLPDLALLRFRDDGQYVLAQDETGIVVFTREPFKAKFRIDAPDAKAAKFTPDKKSIVFHYGDLYVSPRVERWSLADGTREDVSDVHVWGGCRQSELAPDGKTLLCVKDGQVYGGLSFLSIGVTYDLRVVDVESGDIIFEKKNFGRTELNIFALLLSSYFNAVNADFSPDSRFMMVSSGAEMICLDLQSKALFSLPGDFKSATRGYFTFVGNDRVLGRPQSNYKYSIVKFPSGEKIQTNMEFGMGRPTPASKGDYVLIRPVEDYPLGIYDIKKRNIVRAYRTTAHDIYGEYYVHQRADADVEVRDVEKNQVWDKASLPRPKLSRVRSAAVSPDLSVIAASLQTRGAVWDLSRTKRLSYLRGFLGAYLPDNSLFYAQFPKLDEQQAAIAEMNVQRNTVLGQRPLDEKLDSIQFAKYVLVTKPKDEKNHDKGYNIEVRDLKSDAVLWTLPDVDTWSSRFRFGEDVTLPERFSINEHNGTLALWGTYASDKGKKLIEMDPEIAKKAQAMRDKKSTLYVAIYDLQTGKRLQSLLLDTGKWSYLVREATLAGDRVVISDNRDRILIFDKQGQQMGRFFARSVKVSGPANTLCVNHPQGRMEFYDLTTLKKRDELVFPESVTIARLSGDGKRMLVVTADQTVYTLDLMKISAGAD